MKLNTIATGNIRTILQSGKITDMKQELEKIFCSGDTELGRKVVILPDAYMENSHQIY